MALDIAILAVPGLGTTVTSQTLCSCSLLFGVGCIFAGTMVQHFGERMRSIDFAVRFTLFFLKNKPDITDWTGILPAKEDGDACRHYKHTDFFLCIEVSKLRS
jgi:hypothetical protein